MTRRGTEFVARRDHDVRVVVGDIYAAGPSERDYPIGDAMLLGVGIVVVCPLLARSGAVPLVRRKLVDDGGLVGSGCHGALGIALIEPVRELVHWYHHILLLRCGVRRRCEGSQGERLPVDFHRASRSGLRHSHSPAITAGGRRQFSCRATMTIWPR